jgi:putative transposase
MAMDLCVAGKTQIQALDRTQPLLPMGLGNVQGVSQHSIRHGTTTLFAALDVATGVVITQRRARHHHQDIQRLVDNSCTHKHAKLRSGLAQQPSVELQYSPTYASWL